MRKLTMAETGGSKAVAPLNRAVSLEVLETVTAEDIELLGATLERLATVLREHPEEVVNCVNSGGQIATVLPPIEGITLLAQTAFSLAAREFAVPDPSIA